MIFLALLLVHVPMLLLCVCLNKIDWNICITSGFWNTLQIKDITNLQETKVLSIRTVVIVKNFNGPFCEKLLVKAKKKKKKKKKKDRDPTISAVTNILLDFIFRSANIRVLGYSQQPYH